MASAEPSLVEKVLLLDAALSAHAIGHAFGGALALAYYTLDPRATADIDVNISVAAPDAGRVFEALPSGVERTNDVHSEGRRPRNQTTPA